MALERGFSRLTSLQCRVEPLWSPHQPNEVATPAKGLSNILQEASKLERLELVYREAAFEDDPSAYTYFNPNCDLYAQSRTFWEEFAISKQLLLDSTPALQHLQRCLPAPNG